MLEGEGVWDTHKEILGWIFDGINRTMELPPNKLQFLDDHCRALLRQRRMEHKAFESFLSKCQHTSLGIPGGQALLTPLYRLLHSANRTSQSTIIVHPDSPQWHTLTDLRTMFKIVGSRPTKCAQLVPGLPTYIGHTDASKHGVGGTWLAGTHHLRPMVWRLPWPPTIVARVDSSHLTINDLKMALRPPRHHA